MSALRLVKVKTPWRKLYVLSFAGALSWLGSTLTTFTVILRDKDNIGAIGVFGVREVFMASALLAVSILVVFGPEVRRAGREHRLEQ